MGGGSWDPKTYASYSSSIRGTSTDKIFASTASASAFHAKAGAKDSLNPLGVKIRESRDSVGNPLSTACIVALDVTGSMGMLSDHMVREGLGICFDEILKRKPITDPHLMFMAVGDAECDEAPLQVSQFEADDKIIPQLTDIYIEKNGGGNSGESYHLPWYFAATHTSIDCIEKRNKKGYLFTVGDEPCLSILRAEKIKKFIGDTPERDFTNAELLTMVGRMYHVFHIIVAEGNHARHYPDSVRSLWSDILGQRALWLEDHTKLSEVIVSAIEVTEGRDRDEVAKSWSGDTSLVVAKAIGGLTARPDASSGVQRL
jgi:hypothetical protein